MNEGIRNRNKVRKASHTLKEVVQWVLAGKEAFQRVFVGKEANQWETEGKGSVQCSVFVDTGLVDVVPSWIRKRKLFFCLILDGPFKN